MFEKTVLKGWLQRWCVVSMVVGFSVSWAAGDGIDRERIIEFFSQYAQVEGDLQLEYKWTETMPHTADLFSPPARMPEGLAHQQFPVEITLGTDRLLYKGASSMGISASNPEPRIEPKQMAYLNGRSTKLFFTDGEPSQVTYFCNVLNLPGTDEYLFFSQLYGRIPLGVREGFETFGETLETADALGWQDGPDGDRVFVFSKELSATYSSGVREWQVKTEPRPYLARVITRTSANDGSAESDYIFDYTFDWKDMGGHWIPAEIEMLKYQEHQDPSTWIRQGVELTSFKIAPSLDDSYFSLEVPTNIKVVDKCAAATGAPQSSRFGAGGMLLLLVLGFSVAGFAWWTYSRRVAAS